MKKINFKEKLSQFTDHWAPKVIAEMNDYQFKLVKIKGDFVWHQHSHTDEVFIVLEGSMSIKFEENTVELSEGEMLVVNKGNKHKPFANKECLIMLVEPKGVVNTGDATSNLTAPKDLWI